MEPPEHHIPHHHHGARKKSPQRAVDRHGDEHEYADHDRHPDPVGQRNEGSPDSHGLSKLWAVAAGSTRGRHTKHVDPSRVDPSRVTR